MIRNAFKLVIVAAITLPSIVLAQGIAQTAHNLSVSGPGNVRATSENSICVFCHASHISSGAAGTWNRRASRVSYIPYTSSTVVAQPGQPTGTSILCLSCHDGTIALGELINRSNAVVMSASATPAATTDGAAVPVADMSLNARMIPQTTERRACVAGCIRFAHEAGR